MVIDHMQVKSQRGAIYLTANIHTQYITGEPDQGTCIIIVLLRFEKGGNYM